jgi:HSP20 family protein
MIMVLSKSSHQEMETPTWNGLTWPAWTWLDEMFHDGDARRGFKVEECNDGQSLVVRAELPGVNPEKDVRIEIIDNELVIRAEKSETHEAKGKHSHRSEFRYGSMMRAIPVPKGVDESSIEATYKDGVLEVRMALPTESKDESKRRIEIKRA